MELNSRAGNTDRLFAGTFLGMLAIEYREHALLCRETSRVTASAR